MLTGTARVMQEARDEAAANLRGQEIARRRREIGRRQADLERQIAELQASLEIEATESQKLLADEERREVSCVRERAVISARRRGIE